MVNIILGLLQYSILEQFSSHCYFTFSSLKLTDNIAKGLKLIFFLFRKSIPKKPSVAAKSKTVIESSSGSESESESDSETKRLARDVTPVPSDVESDDDAETTTTTADKTIPTKVKPVSPQKVSKSPVKDKTKKKVSCFLRNRAYLRFYCKNTLHQ